LAPLFTRAVDGVVVEAGFVLVVLLLAFGVVIDVRVVADAEDGDEEAVFELLVIRLVIAVVVASPAAEVVLVVMDVADELFEVDVGVLAAGK
jgi:hypothetical protein